MEFPAHSKIWQAKALAAELAVLREENPSLRVVFTNGCYDILHPGHVDLLARAKAHGHVLVLGLNTDASVRRLGKGNSKDERPIQSLEVRAFMAAHLASVDYVTHFDEDTPLELIKLLQPHVLIKGGDWPVQSIVGAKEVMDAGGAVFSLPLLQDFSTTSLIKKIHSIS